MLRRGRMVVSSSPMRAMRPRRLLRQFTESACIEALRRYGSRGYLQFRAGRAVVLRLSYRGIFRRPKTCRASRASVGSTGARTDRTSACKLANAASPIGGGALLRPQATRSDLGEDNERKPDRSRGFGSTDMSAMNRGHHGRSCREFDRLMCACNEQRYHASYGRSGINRCQPYKIAMMRNAGGSPEISSRGAGRTIHGIGHPPEQTRQL